MAVLLAAGNCFPADITTLDGITYKEAKVTAVEADGVHITHRYGVVKVLFDKLPGEIRRQYETKGVGSPKAIVEKRAGPVATAGELASRVIYGLVALAFVAGNLYLFALWCFGFWRSGLTLFCILVVSDGAFFVLAAINAVLAINAQWVREVIGRDAFVVAFNVYQLAQPFFLLIAIVGHTISVQWIIRAHHRARRNDR
jgi:hypothetical protein